MLATEMAAATSAATITEKFVGSPNVIPPANMTTAAATTATKSSTPNNNSHQDNNNTNGLSCSYGYEEDEDLHHHQGGIVDQEHHSPNHHSSSQQQVPIWVGLSCKLVSGISKSTTCHDLISSIVPSSQDPSKYVIVEKWKKMERILDPSVKILKVWKAWGDQFGDVSFVLRSSPTADGYIDKKSSRKVHRKRSSAYHQQKVACNEEDCDKEGHRDAMEQLIKLVITQGEAIQAQLKKLRQQEEQIDKYEVKMHRIRSSQLGENYVVDTYLKDDVTKPRRVKRREKSPCKRDAHGNHHHHHHHHHHHRGKRTGEQQQLDADEQPHLQDKDIVISPTASRQPPTSEPIDAADLDSEDTTSDSSPGESSESIKEKTELMENIFQLNVRLTQEEERLVKLGLKIRKLSDKQRKAEWEELALQDISQELEHLKQVTNEQSHEIELNERNLTALEQLLDDKHDHVAFLTHEIQLVDEESEMLQRRVMELNAISGAAAGNSHLHQHAYPTEETPSSSSSVYPSHDHQQEYFAGAVSANEEELEDDVHHHLYQNDEDHIQASPQITSSSSSTASSSNLLKRGGSLNASIRSYNRLPDHISSSPTTVQFQQGQQQQQQLQPQQESCSSSCSHSSSVCVHLGQKQCSIGGGGVPTGSNSAGTGGAPNSTTDHHDNDSNSDTGISSLHSSVDESPMYVLDTLV